MRLLSACLATLCLCASPALADTVTLRDGTEVEGRVIERDGQVEVYDKGEKRVFPREQVKSVETTRQAYRRLLAALQPDDLRGHLDLVRWCEQRKRRKDAKAVRERILVAFPDHVPTRQALGYFRHEGRWITRKEYMRSLELVKSRDGRSWVSEEKRREQEAAAAAAAQEPEVEALLRQVASKGPDAVRPRLAEFPDAAVLEPLRKALRFGDSKVLRQLAAEELGRRRAAAAEVALARAAVDDTRHEVRDAALGALNHVGSTRTRARKVFVEGLKAKSVFRRAHAAAALGAFKTPWAVPVLIEQLRETTSGFGTVSISIKTERAYIRDYELTSGGTGQTAAEVANPQVGTSAEGVTLEVKVVQWYRERLVRVLQRTTGQTFGASPKRWQRWWREQQRD